MARWTNPSFEFESVDHGTVRVTLELSIKGSCEEPELEEDSAALIESVESGREIGIMEFNGLEQFQLLGHRTECIAKTLADHSDAVSREIAESDQDRYYDMIEEDSNDDT